MNALLEFEEVSPIGDVQTSDPRPLLEWISDGSPGTITIRITRTKEGAVVFQVLEGL